MNDSAGHHEAVLLVELQLASARPLPSATAIDPLAHVTADGTPLDPTAAAAAAAVAAKRERRKRRSKEHRRRSSDEAPALPTSPPAPTLSLSCDACTTEVVGVLRRLVAAVSCQDGVKHKSLPPPAAGWMPSLEQEAALGDVISCTGDEEYITRALAAASSLVEAHWILPTLVRTRCCSHAAVIITEFPAALANLHTKRTSIIDGALQAMRTAHAAEVHAIREGREKALAEQIEAGKSQPPKAETPVAQGDEGDEGDGLSRRESSIRTPPFGTRESASRGESREVKRDDNGMTKAESDLQESLKKWSKQHHVELEKLNKSMHAASAEVSWPLSTLELGLVALMPTPMLDALSLRAATLARGACVDLAADARLRHTHIKDTCDSLLDRIASRPDDLEALAAQEAMMENLHLDLETVALETTAARLMTEELEYALLPPTEALLRRLLAPDPRASPTRRYHGWQLSDDDFALAMRVRSLPSEVVSAAEDRVHDLDRRKKAFAAELSRETQGFIESMAMLARASEDFRTHLDLEQSDANHLEAIALTQVRPLHAAPSSQPVSHLVARVCAPLPLTQSLQKARLDGERINRREGLLDWPITSYEMLEEVAVQIKPYASLWEVAVEVRHDLPVWYDGPFLLIDPAEVATKTIQWMATLHAQVRHLPTSHDISPHLHLRPSSPTCTHLR